MNKATKSPKKQRKRVGSGRLVVLGLSAAKVLCRRWREIAQQRHIDEKEAMVRGMPVTAGVLLGTAQGLETAIRDIQRRMERAKKRQPQHNGADQPRPANVKSL